MGNSTTWCEVLLIRNQNKQRLTCIYTGIIMYIQSMEVPNGNSNDINTA